MRAEICMEWGSEIICLPSSAVGMPGQNFG